MEFQLGDPIRESSTQEKRDRLIQKIYKDEEIFVLESVVKSIGEECCKEATEYLAQSRTAEAGE